MAAQRPLPDSPYAASMRETLARWDRANGKGGYPTCVERAFMKKVLEERDALLAAARAMSAVRPGNWDDRDDHDQVDAWLALDAALAKATGQPS